MLNHLNVDIAVSSRLCSDFENTNIKVPGLQSRLQGSQFVRVSYHASNHVTCLTVFIVIQDWNFTTTNMPGLNGRSVSYPRGFVLGGSTAISEWTKSLLDLVDVHLSVLEYRQHGVQSRINGRLRSLGRLYRRRWVVLGVSFPLYLESTETPTYLTFSVYSLQLTDGKLDGTHGPSRHEW